MKKIFSAFLLMTMMVASVGSFVSCSDIEESIAAVDEATKDNAAAVEALKGEIAALKTALATAQADAAAAKTEANAAKQAAATAKAEAIAAALAEIEKVNGDVDAMQAVIDGINAALTGKADVKTVELLQATIDEYKALIDANGTASTANAAAIAALEEALAALGENVTPEQLAEVVAKMEAIDAALIAFQSRIQSVAYVPQSSTAPVAKQYTIGDETTDYFIQLAYQVSPVSAAAELEDAEVYAKGIVVKAEAPVKYETKVLSVDEKTGMVEVLVYIPEEAVEAVKDAQAVVVALAIENENGVEITSTYEKFDTDSDPFTSSILVKKNTNNHKIPYDTAIADSKVDLINSLEFVVKDEFFTEETPLAEALEFLNMENVEIERVPENRFGAKYITVTTSKYDNGTTAKTDDFEVLKATVSADSKNVTAEFAEAYATVKDASKLVGEKIIVTLSKGFFTIADQKLPYPVNITYEVARKENKANIEIEDVESAWIPVAAFMDVPYSGIAKKEFKTQKVDIVDVNGDKVPGKEGKNVSATIAPDSHDDLTVTLNDFVWPEETTTYTVAGEFEVVEDEDAEIVTVYSYEFTITVDGRPEDVEYEYAPATLPQLPLTAMPNPKDETDFDGKTLAELVSKVKVGTIVTDIAEPYASYYEGDKLVKAIEDKLEKADWTVYEFNTSTDEVVKGIELVAPATNMKAVEFVYETKDEVENSVLKFNYSVANYSKIAGKALKVMTTFDLEGVIYTVIANVQASAWTAPAAFGLELGKFNPETLKGQNPFKWATKNAYWTEKNDPDDDEDDVKHPYNYVEVSKTAAYPYTFIDGDALKLADYLNITNAPADINNYWLVITMKDAPFYTVGTGDDEIIKYYYNEEYTTTPGDHIPYVKVTNTFPLYEGADADDVDDEVITHEDQNIAVVVVNAANLDKTQIYWNNSRANTITLNVELVKATDKANAKTVKPTKKVGDATVANPDYIDAQRVKFSTPKAIQSLEIVGTDVAYEYERGKTLTINLAKHIKVTDLFNEQVNNPYGIWTQVWSRYAWDKYGDGKNVNGQNVTEPTPTVDEPGKYGTINQTFDFFKAYGQEIDFVDLVNGANEPIVGTIIKNNMGFVEGTDFDFDETNGQIIINSNAGQINGSLEFTVRVELSYMNDNYKPYAENITVKVVNAQ